MPKKKSKKKKEMNKKKIFLIIALIIIIAAGLVASSYILLNKDDNETKKIDGIDIITGNDILKDKEIDNLTITNQSIIIRNDISVYQATLVNNSNSLIDINNLYIIFKTDNNNIKSLALLNNKLLSNESKSISVVLDTKLDNLTGIEYMLNN